MVPLSILDLSPITEGSDAGQALRNSLDLARHVEALGFRRYWMAEHHNLPGIASAATAVALAHVAAGTSRIRIGAGGIMLPNHAPLLIAEQFGTLAALHPGRVELGLGRAPGSDQITARAVRRNLLGDVDQFPQDVVELMGYFQPAEPGQAVQAVPGAGLQVPIWILGSSTFGAQLAAYLGLPFAFASHFAPAMLLPAIAIYRERFRPSPQLAMPHVMLGVTVVAAETDAEARFLFSSLQQSSLNTPAGRGFRISARSLCARDPRRRAGRRRCRRAGDRAARPRRVRQPHRRRGIDGDREHFRSRQAQAVVRDCCGSLWAPAPGAMITVSAAAHS